MVSEGECDGWGWHTYRLFLLHGTAVSFTLFTSLSARNPSNSSNGRRPSPPCELLALLHLERNSNSSYLLLFALVIFVIILLVSLSFQSFAFFLAFNFLARIVKRPECRFQAFLLDCSIAGPHDLHCCYILDTDCLSVSCGKQHWCELGAILRFCASAGSPSPGSPGSPGRTK